MLRIDIRTDAETLLRNLTQFQRDQLPFITAYALTTTAKMAQDALERSMRTTFDRPTDWTLNSLFIKPATKRDLTIRIGFKDFASKGTPAGRYLRYHIDGGPREHTGFERALQRAGVLPTDRFAVPTDRLRLDEYGNVPRGLHTKVLSDLQASSDPTQNRNVAKRGRGRLRMLSFFAVSRPGNGMAPGIYINIGAGKQALVWAFVRQPRYRKRWDYHGIVQRTVQTGFAPAFRQAVQFATRTGRRSRAA